ncbi:glycosyl hydrolase family 28-related protein [Dyadobacter sp.]|uniref:glycosyl hydrolase family 28-related protein n=1 Tax=Dyadobacter sp. TaxID=1914288 RepID=UPI003F72AFF1
MKLLPLIIVYVISCFQIARAQNGSDSTPERKVRAVISRMARPAERNSPTHNGEYKSALEELTNLAIKRVPFLTQMELRSGKADSASTVQIIDNDQVGVFKYVFGSKFPDDSVMVIKAGNRTYVRQVESEINAKWLTKSVESSFISLLKHIGTAPQTILVNRVIPITSTLVIPSNVTLRFEQGGGFDIKASEKLTITGNIIAPSSRIVYGAGKFILAKSASPYWLDVKWYGAKGDSTQDDSEFLNKAFSCAEGNHSLVLIPAGTFLINKPVYSPKGVIIQGAGWMNTILSGGQNVNVLTILSGTVIQDIGFSGNKAAQNGITIADGNKVSVNRLRIEGFKEAGLKAEEINNSMFTDLQIKFCRYNYQLVNPLNCSFLNCNGDLKYGNDKTARNVLVLNGRNTRFIGGIFEGTGKVEEHQIEVKSGLQLTFSNLEINSAATSPLLVTGGDVLVDNVQYANKGEAYPSIICTGGQVNVLHSRTTGTGGQGAQTLYKGNVLIDGKAEIPLVSCTFGSDNSGWEKSGGGTATWDPVKRNLLIKGKGKSQGARIAGLSGVAPAGQVVRIAMVLKNISTDKPVALYATIVKAPYRMLISKLLSGYNEFLYTYSGEETYGFQLLVDEDIEKSMELAFFKAELVARDNSGDLKKNSTLVVAGANTDEFSTMLSASGDGKSRDIKIKHNLGAKPSFYIAQANNEASAGIKFVDADEQNIMIHYERPPSAGKDNLKYSVSFKK